MAPKVTVVQHKVIKLDTDEAIRHLPRVHRHKAVPAKLRKIFLTAAEAEQAKEARDPGQEV